MPFYPLLVFFVGLEVADQPCRERLSLALPELGNLLVNFSLVEVLALCWRLFTFRVVRFLGLAVLGLPFSHVLDVEGLLF